MINLDKKCTIEKCCVCADDERCRDNRTSLTFELACPKEIRIRLNNYGHMYTDKEKVLMLDILAQYELGNIVEKEKEKRMETKTYEQGLEEAWKIANNIAMRGVSEGGYSISDMNEIFGEDRLPHVDILRTMNIREVKAKIDAWEAEKNKPKLGDVVEGVELKSGVEVIGIYLGINTFKGSDFYTVFEPSFEEPTFLMLNEWDIKKTGKHFDIKGMLDEIS